MGSKEARGALTWDSEWRMEQLCRAPRAISGGAGGVSAKLEGRGLWSGSRGGPPTQESHARGWQAGAGPGVVGGPLALKSWETLARLGPRIRRWGPQPTWGPSEP